MSSKTKVEEVHLEHFTSWFEDKLFHALSYELSRINSIQLELMSKVSALQNGCEQLRKYVVGMNILAQNQKPVLKLFDQVDSILAQFTSNQHYVPVSIASNGKEHPIMVSSIQPLPDTDYLKNYLYRLRNKARTLEEQFSSSKVVKNMEPADSSRLLPAVTNTLLRPLLNIVATIDELDAEYAKHVPLIEHISDLKATVHKPLQLLLTALHNEQLAQVAAGTSSQDAALVDAVGAARAELDRCLALERVRVAAAQKEEVDVLLGAYLAGPLDCFRDAAAFVDSNGAAVEVQASAQGSSQAGADAAAFNELLVRLRSAAAAVNVHFGSRSNIQAVQTLGGGCACEFLLAVRTLQDALGAVVGAGRVSTEAVRTRQALFSSSMEMALFAGVTVDVDRLAVVIDDVAAKSIELGECCAVLCCVKSWVAVLLTVIVDKCTFDCHYCVLCFLWSCRGRDAVCRIPSRLPGPRCRARRVPICKRAV